MTKILVIILVTVLLVFWFRHMANKRAGPAPGAKKQGKAAEDMVRCQTCGVNLPRSEALLVRGRFYCCDEHRRSDA